MTELLWMLGGLAWRSTVLIAAGAALAWLLSNRSAAVRHLVWTGVFAGLLATPVFMLILPEFGVPAPEAIQRTDAAVRLLVNGSAAPLQKQQSQPDTPGGRPKLPVPTDWSVVLVAILCGGCLLSMTGLVTNWTVLWLIRRKAVPLRDGHADALCETLGVRQPVDVRLTSESRMPMVFGILHPAVLLPRDATDWHPGRLRMVLLHELAHVRRGDVATQWMARLGVAMYWWNPLVFYAWSRFLQERERATDDLVLSAGEAPTEYAHHLLEIARNMQTGPSAAVAMARKSELEGRLMAILNSKVARAGSTRATVAAALLVAMVVSAPLASLRAQEEVPLPDVEALIRRAQAAQSPEVLKAAIQTAERARRPEIAQQLTEAALPLQAKAAGETSVDQGLLLLKLGDLQRRRGKSDEAVATYHKALTILGDRRETVDAITYFGIRALVKDDFAVAEEYLNKAQTIDPSKAGVATMWMAMVRTKQNNLAEAETLFQSALARLPAESIDSAAAMELYSLMLFGSGRQAEAKTMGQRADAIRKALAVEPPPSPAGGVHRIGGNISPPQLSSKIEPAYSDEARAARFQGTVVVYAEISPDGTPHRLRVIRRLGFGLDERALDAIAQWRFKPGTKDGQPVNVAATIEVNFRLL